MEIVKTNKITYDAMEIIERTFNFVGAYNFTHQDGETIEGYQYKDINENNKDVFTPIVKIECSDGYFYATNYKDDVKNHL